MTREIPAVMIRPIEPSDSEGLALFHERLSSESQRLRFFSVHPHLQGNELEHFVNVDGVTRVALVALLDHEIVGVARYERGENPRQAEVAVVVRDDMQGRGIGKRLLAHLYAHAAADGVDRLTAMTLPENRAVRGLFKSVRPASTARFVNGVVEVEIPLTEE